MACTAPARHFLFEHQCISRFDRNNSSRKHDTLPFCVFLLHTLILVAEHRSSIDIMRPWILYCILLASSVCQMVGLVMFAKGFFPYKSISTTFAAMDDLPVLPFTGASPGTSGPEDNGSIRPRYGKVVLMLVDALRRYHDKGNRDSNHLTSMGRSIETTLTRFPPNHEYSDFLYGNESDFRFVQRYNSYCSIVRKEEVLF